MLIFSTKWSKIYLYAFFENDGLNEKTINEHISYLVKNSPKRTFISSFRPNFTAWNVSYKINFRNSLSKKRFCILRNIEISFYCMLSQFHWWRSKTFMTIHDHHNFEITTHFTCTMISKISTFSKSLITARKIKRY